MKPSGEPDKKYYKFAGAIVYHRSRKSNTSILSNKYEEAEKMVLIYRQKYYICGSDGVLSLLQM